MFTSMPGALPLLFSTLIIYISSSLALTLPSNASPQPRGTNPYPFDRLIAFGDELSDNGNGSYAHGITGTPATVYGYGTWTNGPVAVSYLADLLGVHLTRDYAFGAANGGSEFGATVDNAYTSSPAGAQSLVQQVANYTNSAPIHIASSLQFVWVGENDLSAHTDSFWEGDPHNAWFAANISTKIASSVSTLLSAGAPYVFVANIYPKHLAPVTTKYLCGSNTACVETWGQVIQSANAAIEAALVPFGESVIYYDVYSYMVGLLADGAQYGLTQPTQYYCDGDASDPDEKWTECMTEGMAAEFFWMSFVNPTTRVHQLIAGDMAGVVAKHFGM